MGISLAKTILAAVLGGTLCMDRVFLQAMVSRPVVVAPVVGFALGDVATGLIIGALVELLWIDHLPVGVYIPPNDSIVAVVATGSTVLAGEELGQVTREMIALAVLLLLPLGHLAQRLDRWIAVSNNALSDRAVRMAEAGDTRGITGSLLRGLLKTLVFHTGFIFLFLLAGEIVLVKIYPLFSGDVPMRGLGIVFWSLPLIGVAAVLNTVRQRGVLPVFAGIFFLAVFFGTLFRIRPVP